MVEITSTDREPDAGGQGAGRPYHLVVPPGSGRWLPLIGTVLIVLGWFLVGFAVVAIGAGAHALWDLAHRPGGPFAGQILDTAFQNILLAVTIVVIAGVARVQDRRLGTISSVQGRLRLRYLAACAGLAAVLLILQVVVEAGIAVAAHVPVEDDAGSGWPGLTLFALAGLVVLVTVPFQAASEEYLARGWLLQMLGTWTGRAWPGVLVGGAVWSGLHAPTSWPAVVYLTTWSLTLGWLVWRTGGLEAGIALHATNNVLLGLLLAAEGHLSAATGAANAGNADWQALDGAAVLLVYAPVAVLLHRRMGLARTTPPGRETAVP